MPILGVEKTHVPSPYRRYVTRYRRLTRAVEAGDGELLRRIELELANLAPLDQHVVRMAIHDVSRHVPMRGSKHFERSLAVEQRPPLASVGG
jgi:hypothetical protein